MKTFKEYLEEQNMVARTVDQVLAEVTNLEDLKSVLSSLGLESRSDPKSKKRIIIQTSERDRVSFLKTLASKIPNAKYSDAVSGSSVGGIVTDSGFQIIAKPAKGGGSGAGADITKLAESAQCVYCAVRWYFKGEYTAENLKAAMKYVNIDDTIDRVLQLPDTWVKSSISTADVLYKQFGSKRYVFHRGSPWVDKLETLFKKLNKREQEFSNLNKWSPADIYMVAADNKENFSNVDSLVELNARLLDGIRSKNIIGVSLKQTPNAKLSYQNLSNNKSTYEIKNPFYTLGKRGFFDSKDTFLRYNEGEVQFRTFSSNGTSWQGEIKGKYANHGKIGGQVVSNICKRITNRELNLKSIKLLAVRKDKNLLDKFYTYYSALESNPMSKDKFIVQVSDKNTDWIVSKYLGTELVYFLGKGNIEKMIGSMISYASSNSEMSAPFVKVS